MLWEDKKEEHSRVVATRRIESKRKRGKKKVRRQPGHLRADVPHKRWAKKSSLEQSSTEHGYSHEIVKRLFQWNAMGHGFTPGRACWQTFLKSKTRYGTGVVGEEISLRDELITSLVKSWDSAHEGIVYLLPELAITLFAACFGEK